jgi:hypothetical protein
VHQDEHLRGEDAKIPPIVWLPWRGTRMSIAWQVVQECRKLTMAGK